MRNLPLLLALLLLSLLVAAASTQASVIPVPGQVTTLAALADEEEDESEAEEAEDADESEEAELDESEPCEPEEGEPCEEEAPHKSMRKVDECLLKSAGATVAANPGKRRLRLTVHYRTLKPASVTVEVSLRGPKGVLFLGNEHTRFRRSGVYRDTFELPEKKMKRALAARDFVVKLQAVNTPPSCQVELTAHRDGAKKLLWS